MGLVWLPHLLHLLGWVGAARERAGATREVFRARSSRPPALDRYYDLITAPGFGMLQPNKDE